MAALETGTLIVGSSAAGLATAACLKDAGQAFEILEASQAVGNAWRHHYKRLHLHTPKSGSMLPGLPMPRQWPRYATRDQVIEYLERYREHHDLAPHYQQQVTSLQRRDGLWRAKTSEREWCARNVVIATGATRRPVRPSWPGQTAFRGTIMHSSEYQNGAAWRGRTVLVVGFGNSACEQAIDLVEHGALPHLAVRSAVNVIPRDLFGFIPILQLGIWMRHLPTGLTDAIAAPLVQLTIGDLAKLGLRKLPYGPNTQIARDRRIPLLDIGTIAHMRAGQIAVHVGIARFNENGVQFEDGSMLALDAVVLATGFQPALEEFLPDWRDVCDDSGRPLISGGATKLPGLYFCGQHVSPAGMLREIGIEAKRIAAAIASVR